ncbi:MAG: Rho termination factor N-terminal domain-containing protein [Pseudomonas sp.]
MTRGSKAAYSAKQKRQAQHIEESYEARGVSQEEAEARAWATVNKQSGGGERSGSGRKKPAAAKSAARSASARQAVATRKTGTRPDVALESLSKSELLHKARTLNIADRSTMRKGELVSAIQQQSA